ncbi:MAG: dipeptidase [Anaerolineae bacterium]|nr:dipeptidase [Anaerolineae bacterium]
MTEAALIYARDHRQQHLRSLSDLLCIPSVSTLAEHQPDMERAAAWLADYLKGIGMDRAEVMPTGGHPAVYAEWLGAGAQAPTLLAYGHYDVQPVDPLAEWHTPPFEPAVRGDDLFARGSSDDKGQVFAIVAAAEAYLQSSGRLPINLKLLFEGEEEITSPSLAPFVKRHQQMLAADAVLICDQAMLSPQVPLIMYGLRGMAYMEVEVRGPAQDLHSGTFGGVVDNPFNVLVRLLAQLKDPVTHRVLIPGFYDRVRTLSDEERALLARLPLTDEQVRRLAAVPALAGEKGYTATERGCARPTLDIHGMPGGFAAAGKKTVIPARAGAKVSMRLVPDQDPDEVARLFEAYLRSNAPRTVELEVRALGLARPVIVDLHGPAIQAAAEAYRLGMGFSPAFQRGGGTVPIVRDFQDLLGVPIVMIGFGLPDDNNHAPNEKLNLTCFYQGIETLIHYYALFAGAKTGK